MVMLFHSMVCLQLDAVTVRQSPLPVILLFVVFVGLCDGVAQGAIFGDVALLPPKYTQVWCTPSLGPPLPSRPFDPPPSLAPRPLSHLQNRLDCKIIVVIMAACTWCALKQA